MTTTAFDKNTSQHLFISLDRVTVFPNETHPIWRGFSGPENTRIREIAQELETLHELQFSDSTIDAAPWRSAFEMIVNEAAWGAIRALPPESLDAGIGQSLERGGVARDGLNFLLVPDWDSLQARLQSSAIMGFRYGMSVQESVRQELFGWLEEYTGWLADNLAEQVDLARLTATQNERPTLHVWKEDGF